jgi:formate dehydrogenase subunit delta
MRLACEIAAQFRSADLDEAASAIATHIQRFWDPRMREQLCVQAREVGPDCEVRVAAAVKLLESVH